MCAGAVSVLVDALTPALSALSGSGFSGSFGAAQPLYDRVRAGEAADVVVLTKPMIEYLCATAILDPASARTLGTVVMAVAVPEAHARHDVSTVEAFKGCLAGADAIYLPDMAQSIPGFHTRQVIRELGLEQALNGRIKEFVGGGTAMIALAQSHQPRAIGCNQLPNVLATPGIISCGIFPAPYECRTTYVAAVSATTQAPEAAHAIVECLTAPHHAAIRERTGIGPVEVPPQSDVD